MQKIRLFKCWKALAILLCVTMFSVNLYAQNTTVKGTVVDEKGEGLPGATVKLKSTTVGAVTTDVNGKFTISVPAAQKTVVVSYVGYINQEIAISTASLNLKIALVPISKNLNEVVVVGYGTQKKRDVTGSIVSISETALQEVPSPNVIDQLKGRVAGLDITSNSTTPGAAGQIRIRGERSFASTQGSADSQNGPLFVVDGVPFIGGSINDLNQDDIVTVDVLKDASATAIYGSRASGGVILITTKRGKNGRSSVSFNTYAGFSKITNEYPIQNAQEYVAFKQQSIIGNPALGTSYGFTTAELAGIANGTNTDWQKTIFRTGAVNDNDLNISGGTEATQFSISGGYHYEKGIQYAQDFDRGSLRAAIDHNVNDRIKVGLTTFQTLTHTNNPGGVLYNTVSLSPLTSPYNADGSVNLLPMVGSTDATKVNPLTLQNPYIQNVNRRLYSFNTVYGEIKIIDGLKYHLNATLTYGQNQQNVYTPVSTIFNTNTSVSNTTESVSNSENYTWLLENIITYDKVIAQKHHITFTGLYSSEKDHSQGQQVSGIGLPADYLQSYNLFLANTVSTPNGSYAERGLISYMARINYTFNGKYLLTATVRSDGSSVLTSGSQYFTYPAFALGWNIDQENFMKKQNIVNALKLRLNAGVTADQNVSPYQILGSLTANAYNFGNGATTSAGQIGYLVTNLPNSLQFEHTNNYGVGLDFGLFQNRITGTLDLYKQKTFNVLQTESLPGSNGAGQTTVNAGNSEGEGYELGLSAALVKSKDPKGFTWSADFNMSAARNKIVSLHDNLTSDITNGWFVGQPFNVIYDYKKIGIWQQSEAAQAAAYGTRPGQIKVQDVSGPKGVPDGVIDANDRQLLGSYQPNFTGGLTFRFSYQNVDLSFVAFARLGQMVAVTYLGSDSGGSGYPFFNQGRANQYKVNYWTPTNPTNDFPQPDASQTGSPNASTLQYRDGSFIKMRSINLGYTLPNKLIKRAGFSSLRIYATCANPFIIYSPLVKSGLGIDPEGNGYGNQLAGVSGYSANALGRAITVGLNNPPARTFQLGINAKF